MTEEKELLKKYDISLLEKDLRFFSVTLNEIQIKQFLTYYELLIHWNSFMNLTGITEYTEVIKKHFVDSLSIAEFLDLRDIGTLIDVGTGAGFPGIPLKIVYPHLRVTLLDSLNKRIRFLDEVIKQLGLEEIETVHGRAEDFARPGILREQFDLCVSRAVANLSTLAEYCLPFVRTGGIFASYKSEKVSEELGAAEKAVRLFGGIIKERQNFVLPDTDMQRSIIFIGKKKETPAKYPRKAGLPSKEPLY